MISSLKDGTSFWNFSKNPTDHFQAELGTFPCLWYERLLNTLLNNIFFSDLLSISFKNLFGNSRYAHLPARENSSQDES